MPKVFLVKKNELLKTKQTVANPNTLVLAASPETILDKHKFNKRKWLLL